MGGLIDNEYYEILKVLKFDFNSESFNVIYGCKFID